MNSNAIFCPSKAWANDVACRQLIRNQSATATVDIQIILKAMQQKKKTMKKKKLIPHPK